MKSLLTSAFLFLGILTLQAQTPSEEPLMLVTIQTKAPENATETVTRIKYIYLTTLSKNNLKSVCDAQVAGQIGYKEVWRNSYPKHPEVWERVSKERIEPSAAKKYGCALENKEIGVRDLQKFPELYDEYFSR
jgi:hypothetical protein